MPLRRQLACFGITVGTLLAVLATAPAGLAFRKHPAPIVGTPANRLADEILHSLVSTPLGRAAPPIPWSVRLVDDWRVNAYIEPTGSITITNGMAYVFGEQRGLWAAVLGHEIGHFVVHRQFESYLPGFQAELDKACRQAHDARGQPMATLRLVSINGGRSPKLAREREGEADRVGMMLMAEAGYHPDFVILVDQTLHNFFGDEPKLTAFLASHPRWAEREQRARQDHDIALAIFKSRWPDALKSPGGPAPAFGTIESVTVAPSERSEPPGLTLHVTARVRNAGPRQVRVEAIFLEDDRPVGTTLAGFRTVEGWLAVNLNLPHPPTESTDVALRVPAAAFPTGLRKLKAEVFLIAGEQILYLALKPVETDFLR
jgi:peptidase M48-like protein